MTWDAGRGPRGCRAVPGLSLGSWLSLGRGPERVPGPIFMYAASRAGVMTEVLLFHHAQGQTPGFLEFAGRLRERGHVVHTPDLYEGKTFSSLDEGVAHAKKMGFDTIAQRGLHSAEGLPRDLVYGGFSLGVMPAQSLAQNRPGARGALLFSGAFPPEEFGRPWPKGVALEIHMMEKDPWVLEGDLEAARKLVASVEGARLFLYPGNGHLFADSSLPDFDPGAAALLLKRTLAFLKKLEGRD